MSSTSVDMNDRFYRLFEAFISSMTDLNEFNLEKILGVLKELCIMLRVSKGVTTFYESAAKEALGEGEEVVCHDSGAESVMVSMKRAVSPMGMVVCCAVYQEKGDEPFNEAERGRVELIQSVIVSNINRHRQQNMVDRMAFWDGEGYRNLRGFMVVLGKLSHAGRLPGMAAFRVNLKHFSLVNEQFGREAANDIMKAYYGRLSEIAGKDGCVARLGGDNFVALCHSERLGDMRRCLEGHTVAFRSDESQDHVGQARITISAVAGAYVVPADFTACTFDDVMDRIMAAYQAAKSGKNGDIVFYDSALEQEKEHVMRVQRSFERALRQEEFQVYYQPKVDINTRELIGAEALCRWHRGGRIVPPSEFIPVLEQGSDICRLDFYMLEHACRDIRRWRDMGLHTVKVSVNLSRRHMMDPDLLEHIIGIVDQNGVPHECVEIELTETTTDVEFRDLKRVVKGLQAAGIWTSVDDFGVGYSSLNLIKEIPWNVLKLDRSLLPDSSNMKRGAQMYRHIVSMAREIGLECVAEGVETAQQLDILREYGCDIAQGFYFDKPLPVDEFEKKLECHNYCGGTADR